MQQALDCACHVQQPLSQRQTIIGDMQVQNMAQGKSVIEQLEYRLGLSFRPAPDAVTSHGDKPGGRTDSTHTPESDRDQGASNPLPASLARLKVQSEAATPASPPVEKLSSLTAVSPTGQGGTPTARFYAGVRQACPCEKLLNLKHLTKTFLSCFERLGMT